MTTVANVYSVYDATAASGVGLSNREDLADILYDISPLETPIFSSAARKTASAVFHEWTTDALASAAHSPQIEGEDVTADAAAVRTRFGNYTQIQRKVPAVTRTQQVVMKAGIENEMAYQVGKRMKEIKRDIEFSMTNNNARVTGSESAARVASSLQSWMTNASRGASGAAPGTQGTSAQTNGTARAIQEGFVNTVSQLCFTAGGNPTVLVVPVASKVTVSGFAGNQVRESNAADKTLITAVDVYATDFHSLKIVADRFLGNSARDAFLLDPDYFGIAWLDPIKTQDLAKTGDHERKLLTAEWTLEVGAPGAHGIVADLV